MWRADLQGLWRCVTLALVASVVVVQASPGLAAGPSNTLTLTNPSSATLTNDPVQLGRPFVQGEIPSFPQALVNGTLLLTQADVKTRWPDGSVKHAILSFILPSLAANASATVTVQNQTSGNNTPLTAAEMLGSNFNFDAAMELTNGGTTVSASARQMLQDGNVTYWTQGPVATTVILAAARAGNHQHVPARTPAKSRTMPQSKQKPWPLLDTIQQWLRNTLGQEGH